VADPRGEPRALGRDWWVLGNALRLHGELGRKKGREMLRLRDLKVSYPAFPEGSVFAWETPDFLVETPDGRRVGVELVDVLRGGARKKGSRHREREEAEETVVALAERIYYAGEPPGPVRGVLYWGSDPAARRPGPLPRPTEELAGEVARLIREGAPVWARGDLYQLGAREMADTPLEGVLSGLSARQTGYVGEDGRDSPWGRVLYYDPETATIEDVAREVGRKDRVHAAYKGVCSEVWLVAVLGGGPSSFEDADDAVHRHPFRSAFDQLVLLSPHSRSGRRAVALPRAE